MPPPLTRRRASSTVTGVPSCAPVTGRPCCSCTARQQRTDLGRRARPARRVAHRHRARPARARLSDKPRGDYSIAGYANGMRDLLSVLDIEQATVVGHSLGGGIALQFAYQFPERCERLVLVGSGGLGPGAFGGAAAGDAAGRRAGAHRAGRRLRPAAHRLPALDRLGQAAGLQRWRPRGGRRGDPRAQGRRGPAGFLRTLRGVVDSRGQAVTALDRLYLANAVPMLVVWGSRDPIVPARTPRRCARWSRPRGSRCSRAPALAAPRRPRPVLRRAPGLPGRPRPPRRTTGRAGGRCCQGSRGAPRRRSALPSRLGRALDRGRGLAQVLQQPVEVGDLAAHELLPGDVDRQPLGAVDLGELLHRDPSGAATPGRTCCCAPRSRRGRPHRPRR